LVLKTEYYKYLTVGHGLRFRQNGFYTMFFSGFFFGQTDISPYIYICLSVYMYLGVSVRRCVSKKFKNLLSGLERVGRKNYF